MAAERHLAAVSNVDDVMDLLDISCPRRGSQPPLWTSLTREIPLDIAPFYEPEQESPTPLPQGMEPSEGRFNVTRHERFRE